MFRTFQQEARQVKRVVLGDVGSPKIIPGYSSATYEQGRLKTIEVLSSCLDQAARGDMTQGNLKIAVTSYINCINMAYTTFQAYGFLFARDDIIAARDYLKGQIECYRLHQARIEQLTGGTF